MDKSFTLDEENLNKIKNVLRFGGEDSRREKATVTC